MPARSRGAAGAGAQHYQDADRDQGDAHRRVLGLVSADQGADRLERDVGGEREVYRWVVERTLAWYHGMKRLRIRWERRDDIHEAFLGLATCVITYRYVRRFC